MFPLTSLVVQPRESDAVTSCRLIKGRVEEMQAMAPLRTTRTQVPSPGHLGGQVQGSGAEGAVRAARERTLPAT